MKHLFQFLFLLIFASCSSTIPVVKQPAGIKIPVGPGPEDMVLDTLSTASPRLLVSCCERRKENSPYGEIGAVNLNDNSYKILPRLNEPQGLLFRPHGFDLIKNKEGQVLLYCISHNNEKKEHSILIYKVFADHLEFQEKLNSPLLVSPNDVTASCDGDIFVSNDAHKRGSMMEALLKLKRSDVVCFNHLNKQWTVVAIGFAYANGIAVQHCPVDKVFLSTTRSDKLFSMQNVGDNIDWYYPKEIAKLKGLDNISFINENEVLVTAHLNQVAFMKHAGNSQKKSPSVVYRVNITTGKYSTVYANDGSGISAASTALYYMGKLYVSQVFEPFILKCDLDLK